jgi:hypothetical protein
LYGPGLAITDFNLGILYMLAVSSLATYGILLAGFLFPANILQTKNTQYYLSNTSKPLFIITKRRVNYNTYPSEYLNISKCFVHMVAPQNKNNCNNSNKNNEEYIKDLFKDRIAPVIPFDRNLIKGSCLNYADKILKAKFLKEWGSKVGIYLIEYKYYPNIYKEPNLIMLAYRNFKVKIYPAQINRQLIRSYTSKVVQQCEMESVQNVIINPWFLTGFTDACASRVVS